MRMVEEVSRVRDAIRAMAAYTLEPRLAEVKLDQNESAFDWPAEFKSTVLERAGARPWNLYPDFEQTRLRKSIASSYGLSVDEVLVGNGSNELLLAVLTTLVSPGTDVVLMRPTFTLYEKIVTIMGGRLHVAAVDPATGELPVNEMIRISGSLETPPVIVVCSPNNPTGGALREGELDALLATGATVVLDRAYGEFAPDSGPRRGGSLVTLSTFSKAWGLAGLRVGWVTADAGLIAEIRKTKLPYNLNVISEEAALLALENRGTRDAHVAHVCSERTRMQQRLGAIPGVQPFPSAANFIAFRSSRPAADLFGALLRQGVLVRDVSKTLPEALRVSIADRVSNDRFLDLLERVMRGGEL